MTESLFFNAPSPTPSFAVMIVACSTIPHIQYPLYEPPYKVQHAPNTYSAFTASPVSEEDSFMLQVAAIYDSLLKRQEYLGDEFETAIFSDLDSLYERDFHDEI